MCLFLCTNVISCVANPGKIVILFQHTGRKAFFSSLLQKLKEILSSAKKKRKYDFFQSTIGRKSIVNYLVTCRLKKIIGKRDI